MVDLDQALAIMNQLTHHSKPIPFDLVFSKLDGEISHKKNLILAKYHGENTAKILKAGNSKPNSKQQKNIKSRNPLLIDFIDLNEHRKINAYITGLLRINGKKIIYGKPKPNTK